MKIKEIFAINGRLPLRDPFIMGAYHLDKYPKGNGNMGPAADISDRAHGNDFDPTAEWRMYHGDKIPGFPYHPHLGFEILTYVPTGYADHCDSLGSRGRYGEGDAQLMSAGSGVLHSEMFPLVHDDKENPLRLFQIWMNLPAKSKMTQPDYKMIWREKMPTGNYTASNGGNVQVKVMIGNYAGVQAIDPLVNSWAADPEHHMGAVEVTMEPGTEFVLPKVSETLNRFVLFYDGEDTVSIAGNAVPINHLFDLNGNEEIIIRNRNAMAKLFILEGEPINEPVVAHGPFVMNTAEEIQEGFSHYRQTQFGGWPWGPNEIDMVNPKDAGRFASYDFDKVIDKPEA